MNEIVLNTQQTALFLADGAQWYAPGEQDTVAELSTMSQADIVYYLTDLNNAVREIPTIYGTLPNEEVIDITTETRRQF